MAPKTRTVTQLILIFFCLATILFLAASIYENVREHPHPFQAIVERIKGETSSHEDQHTISKEEVIIQTNEARKTAAPQAVELRENFSLDASAKAKLDDMVAKGYFEHETPEGYGIEYFIDKEEYAYISIAENLASGDFADAEALVTAWMNSPGHRANIVNPDFTDIGVAAQYVEFQGVMQYVAVQHFGRPASDCPAVDTALAKVIDEQKSRHTSMESELESLQAQINASKEGSEEYRDLVDQYNKLVDDYNSLGAALGKNIDLYNQGVRAFNACIAK